MAPRTIPRPTRATDLLFLASTITACLLLLPSASAIADAWGMPPQGAALLGTPSRSILHSTAFHHHHHKATTATVLERTTTTSAKPSRDDIITRVGRGGGRRSIPPSREPALDRKRPRREAVRRLVNDLVDVVSFADRNGKSQSLRDAIAVRGGGQQHARPDNSNNNRSNNIIFQYRKRRSEAVLRLIDGLVDVRGGGTDNSNNRSNNIILQYRKRRSETVLRLIDGLVDVRGGGTDNSNNGSNNIILRYRKSRSEAVLRLIDGLVDVRGGGTTTKTTTAVASHHSTTKRNYKEVPDKNKASKA